jgi:hypothetical protein
MTGQSHRRPPGLRSGGFHDPRRHSAFPQLGAERSDQPRRASKAFQAEERLRETRRSRGLSR